MSSNSSNQYSAPFETESDRKQFRDLCVHIKRDQDKLLSNIKLSYSEVKVLATSIVYMRKSAHALNTRYRLFRKVP